MLCPCPNYPPGMRFFISGIQQVGVGIPDLEKAWAWHRKFFGMDVPVFREKAEAALMQAYTGGKVHARHAVMALNMAGGGGMEIWQFTSRKTAPPPAEPQLGDYGIFAARIKSPDVKAAYKWFVQQKANLLSDIVSNPAGSPHFFVQDPFGMVYEVVEGHDWFSRARHVTGGPSGCMIGVSNIESARAVYSELLGYDQVLYDESGVFDDFEGLHGGKGQKVRRVLLTHSQPRKGGFSQLLGKSEIELVKVYDRIPTPIFKDRYWGDQGFIHLCFDVHGMDDLEKTCKEKGFPFTVDSMSTFDMGEASGRFSYIEDPDGTLIEFVEAHKIPIMKKWGWYLNLKHRNPEKPLPKWMLKALGFGRVKE